MSLKLPFAVESVNWQDYRANSTGMVVFYTSDPVSEIPIREIPEDIDSTVPAEPNYESGTYGLYSCIRPKVRAAFVKNKLRYLFFVTKYTGPNADFRDAIVITGYYRIVSTADARRFHIRYCSDYECLEVPSCLALRADEVRFVSLEDAFVVSSDVLKSWDYGARVTRQTRIILDGEHTQQILEHLESKPNALQTFLDESERLQPHDDDDDEDEE